MPPTATRSDDDGDGLEHAHSSPDPVAEISDSEYTQDEEDDDEEEIEEIEIEEEVEEEEEQEEEDGDDNRLVSPKSIDVGQKVASERQLESHSTPEMSELSLPPNSPVEDGFCNSKFSGPSNRPSIMHMEESYVNYGDSRCLESATDLVVARENANLESAVNKEDGEALAIKTKAQECSESHYDSKARLSSIKILAAQTNDPSSITEKKVAVVFSVRDSLGDEPNTVMHSKEEAKPEDMCSKDDAEKTTSRLVAPEIRIRNVSPSAEFKDRNKRPAVICDFFAKGWCIRGSACRFLHINDKTENTNKQPEGNETAAKLTSEELVAEAFSHQSSPERSLLQEHVESQRLCQLDDKDKMSSFQREDLSWGIPSNPKRFPSSIDHPGFSSSFKDGEIENQGQNQPVSDYQNYASLFSRSKSPLFQNSLIREHRSSLSGSIIKSSNYCSGSASSYLSSLDDLGCMRSVHRSSLDTSRSRSSAMPSHNTSAWSESLLSFNSLNTSPFYSQKLLDGDRNYHGSRSSPLLQGSSPFFGAESENLFPTSLSGDRLCQAEHKAKISSTDWEPSVPFRPSFLIIPTMASSPGNQYDPVRDSFDLPNVGENSFKLSFSQTTAVLNTLNQPMSGDSLLSPTLGTDCNGDKSTISFQNGMAPKEESASGTDHEKEILNTSKTDVDGDGRHQNGGSRCKKGMKLDQVRQSNEMEVDQKTDGDVQRESKALRHFRSALVDFVKELLKPAWREGHLSKDAHKAIVKKSVAKVLSALRLHQIPTTAELIKQYLSSSQPKIAKLVEGYITKHGKS